MISFIVPTIGRASLAKALASIETWPGDEIIVVGECEHTDPRPIYVRCERGNDWGRKERQIGMSLAKGAYLAFMDDDDAYLPGARAAMQRAIDAAPYRPSLLQMVYPNGLVLWQSPTLACGNVSTQMILIPNDPDRLGEWSERYEGDFDFLQSMKWHVESINWWPEIIARIGHADGAR